MFQRNIHATLKKKKKEISFCLKTSFCIGLILYIHHNLHELMGGQMFLVSHECMETYGETEINMKLLQYQHTVYCVGC